jgi:hypothetical protein
MSSNNRDLLARDLEFEENDLKGLMRHIERGGTLEGWVEVKKSAITYLKLRIERG